MVWKAIQGPENRALKAGPASVWIDLKQPVPMHQPMLNRLPLEAWIKLMQMVAKFDINESAEGWEMPRRALDLRAVDRGARKQIDSLKVEDLGAVLVGDILRDLQWYLYRHVAEGGDCSDARRFFFSGESARMSVEDVVAEASGIPGDRAVVIWYIIVARVDVEPPDVCFAWLLRLVGKGFPALRGILSLAAHPTFEETLNDVQGALWRAPVDKKGSLVPGWNCCDANTMGYVLLSRCHGRPTKNKILKEFCWLARCMPTDQLPEWMEMMLCILDAAAS